MAFIKNGDGEILNIYKSSDEMINEEKKDLRTNKHKYCQIQFESDNILENGNKKELQ